MTDREGKNRIRKNWVRKISRLVFFVLLVFFLSGASLIVIDRYIFPYLATVKWAGKYDFFKKATQDIVVVNKTEQVTVSEDQTISRYSNESASSVVEILSLREESENPGKMKDANLVKYGSGLVITADGLILTHKEAILDGQSKYRIFTQKDKFFDAQLVSMDSFTNLVLLKIDGAPNLPVASFIASEDMKIGMKAVVIGRSGNNFQAIYKAGLVSQYDSDFSLAGALPLSEKLQGVYTADFDMNEEGDEKAVGGAVANYSGNVIGILGVRKISDQKQYFIISSDCIQELVNRYISAGSVKRGALGIYYLPLSSESAALFGGSDRGALVYSPSGQQGLAVISGSAAEKAGLKIMDVIMSVNGEEVNSENNLARLVSKHKPGEEISLKVMRDGKEMEVKVVLE
jgi:serine protease Do